MGHNTREEIQASSRRRREDQDITIQPTAISSRRFVGENRASLATVVLHPCRPPFLFRGANDDAHVWTSIVDRWLKTVQAEPSKQLTYVVSLL